MPPRLDRKLFDKRDHLLKYYIFITALSTVLWTSEALPQMLNWRKHLTVFQSPSFKNKSLLKKYWIIPTMYISCRFRSCRVSCALHSSVSFRYQVNLERLAEKVAHLAFTGHYSLSWLPGKHSKLIMVFFSATFQCSLRSLLNMVPSVNLDPWIRVGIP